MQAEQDFERHLAVRLQRLPSQPLDEALWHGIDGGLKRPVRVWPWAGSAAVALLALLLWPKPEVAGPIVPYELTQQDRQLQQAYLYADSDQALNAQWQRRQQILDDMASRPEE
ncbi:MAG: hypothetical protein VX447_13235 [Pseudomonadota bacterium]|uniref:hypothetical protein n=1 Tax=Gallaecimonas pentaromativorans TaxID=584787 RepID=UPI00067F5552|nr:hypothetical protein [Gallaecimonas pentaromativorans]MED5525701.1 hypothetical protein [Pseudomonadota bacterium]